MVAGAEPERERDHRDEDERERRSARRPARSSRRLIQAAVPEHEHRDHRRGTAATRSPCPRGSPRAAATRRGRARAARGRRRCRGSSPARSSATSAATLASRRPTARSVRAREEVRPRRADVLDRPPAAARPAAAGFVLTAASVRSRLVPWASSELSERYAEHNRASAAPGSSSRGRSASSSSGATSAGPGRRVLDLGCRYGALTQAYAEGNEVVGVDVDREALAEAAEARDRDALGRPRRAAAVRGRELRRRRRRRAARAPARSATRRRRGAPRPAAGRDVRRVGAERLPAQEPAALPRRPQARGRPDAPPHVLAARTCARCSPASRTRSSTSSPAASCRFTRACSRTTSSSRAASRAEASREVRRRPRFSVRGTSSPTRSAAVRRAVEQVGVVEVRVHDLPAGTARDARARACRSSASSAARARARRSDSSSQAGSSSLQMRRVAGEVRRPERGRGAVGVAEVGDRLGDVLVDVPAAAAEEARLEADSARASVPCSRTSAGGIAAGRPRVVGRGPVRVQAERAAAPPPRAPARASSCLVLAVGRRPHQRRDREAAGRPLLQRARSAPRPRRPAAAPHGTRRRRTARAVCRPVCGIAGLYSPDGRAEPRARGRHARRARPPRARRGLDRRLRPLRARPPAAEGDRPRHGLPAGDERDAATSSPSSTASSTTSASCATSCAATRCAAPATRRCSRTCTRRAARVRRAAGGHVRARALGRAARAARARARPARQEAAALDAARPTGRSRSRPS